MGSYFSVYNDSNQTVWIQRGVCWNAIIWPVTAVATAVVTVATAGLGTAATVSGGLSLTAVSGSLGISQAEAKKLIASVNEFKKDAIRIDPGETYKTCKLTLSLVQTVQVLGNNLSRDSRDCWTGSTDGSCRRYTISKDFSNCYI